MDIYLVGALSEWALGGRRRAEVGADLLRWALTVKCVCVWGGGGRYSFSKEGSYSVQLFIQTCQNFYQPNGQILKTVLLPRALQNIGLL